MGALLNGADIVAAQAPLAGEQAVLGFLGRVVGHHVYGQQDGLSRLGLDGLHGEGDAGQRRLIAHQFKGDAVFHGVVMGGASGVQIQGQVGAAGKGVRAQRGYAAGDDYLFQGGVIHHGVVGDGGNALFQHDFPDAAQVEGVRGKHRAAGHLEFLQGQVAKTVVLHLGQGLG